MKMVRRGLVLLGFSLLVGWMIGQDKAPALSTADKVALSSLEKQKTDARTAFDQADQGELTILREWEAAHPGFRINREKGFVVEKKADPQAEEKK
jgi:hypothetical protein